jgi:hypothetical protein
MDNSNKYIGNIKSKGDKIKIIPGEKDDRIISKRNKILGHLDKVLSGGKRLKEEYIPTYFEALGGKYIRNDICVSGDKSLCKGGKVASINGAHKLLKLVSKKNLPVDNALTSFKGSASKLYEKLENKIIGGFNTISYDDNSVNGGKEYNNNQEIVSERLSERSTGRNYHERPVGGRDYYERPDERSLGGRDYYERPDERSVGGRDYYEPNYYPNEMHGGQLGEFRNEIGRNFETILNLRNDILNIDL